jgi:hypothetical protein
MKRAIGLILILAALSGCREKDLSSVSETAGLQAGQQVEAENQNRIKRASEMEADLGTRHRFYQGVRGIYEGTFETDSGTFNLRLTLIPSVPPYLSQRTRTVEEITYDLSNLHFSVQIVQWNPAHPLSAVGCRIEGVHPDLSSGEINIASENCPNVYQLKLTDSLGAKKENGKGLVPSSGRASEQVAESLLQGKLNHAEAIVGQIQPTTTAAIYYFTAERVKQ